MVPLADSDANQLYFGGGLGETLHLNALQTRVCNPETQHSDSGAIKWVLSIFCLEVLLAITWSEMEEHFYRQGAPRTGEQRLPPSVRSDASIYLGPAEMPLFIVEGTARAEPAAGKARAKQPKVAATDFECALCQKKYSAADMQHHMGAHLLQSDWTQYKVTRPPFPCGVCGNSCIGQFLRDPLVVSECTVSIKGKNAQHQCKLIGADQSYGLQSASKCSVKSPCTNRPVACPVRGCGAFVWSYSMEAHFEARHTSDNMSASTAS